MALEQKLKQLQVKINQNPLTSATILISVLLLLLIVIPIADISLRGINNATVEATLENQDRATLAQILGGVAIGIGLYYTWRRVIIAEKDLKVSQDNLEATQKIAQENLKVAQEGQITERFTRAVDQLGDEKLQIRLGGIYALERIANESEKDYWPIMEILTAYVRKNSSFKAGGNKSFMLLSMDIQTNETPDVDEVSLDIQAILTVIKRRRFFFNHGESINLDLQRAHLRGVDLKGANLKKANLRGADLERADLYGADLERADLYGADLKGAELYGAILKEANLRGAILKDAGLFVVHLEQTNLRGFHLESAKLVEAHLKWAKLRGANLQRADLNGADLEEAELIEIHLEKANLYGANLKGAELYGAILKGANLEEASLKGAKNLTVDQLSVVKTLYKAELDPELEKPLREKYPHLFEEPER